ncbi:MAG TPA: RsmE family RNA methyltransferase [Candidatus Sulfotelmatobacter sp.]|nr:RsmE family RNA methyltransferase [Candidatus Sulfotelmatobacter sp.]
MTRRRWIADEVSADRASLTGAHAEHLVRVLRARVGQEFDIVTEGVVRRGRISSIMDGKVEFELGPEISSSPAPANLTLLLAVFKFDRMEWAIEKAAELGVSRVVPVIARRTDAHLASAAVKRVERWRRIVVQAAEQSRRTAPPELSEPVKLQAAVSLPGSMKIVLSEAEQDAGLRDVILANENASDALLAIGPEGGWTIDELDLFRKEGWVSASLGPTILRAETAAIAAVAITTSLLS